MTRPSVAVIGAGAAGLMAALHAARAGADVTLLERTRDGGRKILISGGGRCNILPSVPDHSRYVTDSSPHSLRKILTSWPLSEQRAFLERALDQPLVLEEETGKLFPSSQRARDVRDRLTARVREAGARIWFDAHVKELGPPGGGPERWTVQLGSGDPLQVDAVIVATGGLSVPATGSDGAGLRWAERLGLTVNPTYPALTPLLDASGTHAALAGISLTVTVRADASRHRFETTDGFLFTHRGYSGPSVLDASHLVTRDRASLVVSWPAPPTGDWASALAEGAGTVVRSIASVLPNRLAQQLVAESDTPAARTRAQLRRDERESLLRLLTAYPLPVTGDEGYKKAEVTGGGVALAEFDPRTLQVRSQPGLFMCGEVLDAFGPIGGHNFLWAWATGRAAGMAAALQPGS